VKTTGFLSLYNGLGVTLVGSIPKAGIRFGGNAYCKKLLADDKGKLNMAQQFAAGMGAGTIEAILAVTPMETIKTKLIEVNYLSHLNPLEQLGNHQPFSHPHNTFIHHRPTRI
jgi:solute carrier family 25 (mitochondrial citrate transporter), member 1